MMFSSLLVPSVLTFYVFIIPQDELADRASVTSTLLLAVRTAQAVPPFAAPATSVQPSGVHAL